METKKVTTLTAEYAREHVGVGNAHLSLDRGVSAVYLRHVADQQWFVLAGWAVEEAFDSDYLSQAPVAGMEGVCHAARHYDFGPDVEAAVDYFRACLDAFEGRRSAPTIDRPEV